MITRVSPNRLAARLRTARRLSSSSTTTSTSELPGLGITTDHADGVVVLELRREERLNSLGEAMGASLLEVFDQLASTPPDAASWAHGEAAPRVVVLTGAGDRAFSTGRDLKESAAHTKEDATRYMRLCMDTAEAFRQLPQPTIAAVNGHAFGWGLEMALCADLRLVATEATLCLPETRLGIFPGAGGTVMLPRIVGPAAAAQLVFTAEPISGDRAAEIGLANAHMPRQDLRSEAHRLASKIAANGPLGLRGAKAIMRAGLDGSVDDAMAASQAARFPLNDTADFAEGVLAFKEKRSPVFQGR